MFSKLLLVVMVIFALFSSGAEATKLRAKHQNSMQQIQSAGEPCEYFWQICGSGSRCENDVCVAFNQFHW